MSIYIYIIIYIYNYNYSYRYYIYYIYTLYTCGLIKRSLIRHELVMLGTQRASHQALQAMLPLPVAHAAHC